MSPRFPSVRLFLLAFLLVAGVPGVGGGSLGCAPTATKKTRVAWQSETGTPTRASTRAAARWATERDTVDDHPLFAGLPPLKSEADDERTFALREASAPAPRTGNDIIATFPPPPSLARRPVVAASVAESLAVLRVQPEGEVTLAPQVSVTFSEPMVAVTGHEDTVRNLPVQLSPQVEGKWRWVGTRTLIFDGPSRFPAATNYTLTIPAKTKAANGATLKAGRKFKFATPPPKLVSHFPVRGSGPQRLDPLVVLTFDQDVDAEAVVEKLRFGSKGRKVRARSATQAEIDSNSYFRSRFGHLSKRDGSRSVVVKATERLLPDRSYNVIVPVGTPSAEGPRKTASQQTFWFNTRGPLRVADSDCYNNCAPGTSFRIDFTNQLDRNQFKASSVKVHPHVKELSVGVTGTRIDVRGKTRSNTTYTVRLPETLTDAFGQTLGETEPLTFTVGPPRPPKPPVPQMVALPNMIVIDPTATRSPPAVAIKTRNIASLDVRLYRVEPQNWKYWPRYEAPPGQLVSSETIPVRNPLDQLVTTAIPLSKALGKQGFGHVVITVTPTTWPSTRYKPGTIAWIQSTALGFDAFTDRTETTVWTTRLSDGKPVRDVEVALSDAAVTKTDREGLATLTLPHAPSHPLIARKGSDSTLLIGAWNPGSLPRPTSRWLVYDDRKTYRPGETVSLKGWLRDVDEDEGGDIIGPRPAGSKIQYLVKGPRGNELHKGVLDINRAGGFHTQFKLPDNGNLGWVQVRLQADGGAGHHHTINVQEFRRPEYSVSMNFGEGPHFAGDTVQAELEASYYSGGPLPETEVNWSVSSVPAHFAPPNRSSFSFGQPRYWGRRYHRRGRALASSILDSSGKTDSAGHHQLRIELPALSPSQPRTIIAEATIQDVNRQAIAERSSFLLHPANVYVGLRSKRRFVDVGKSLAIDAVAVDLDGEAVAGRRLRITASHYLRNGKRKTQTCTKTSTKSLVKCVFQTPVGGVYEIVAKAKDDKGRVSETHTTRWVSGGWYRAGDVSADQVLVHPDKPNYAVGDVAELLVVSPFTPAEGVLTVRRSGIVHTERFTMKSSSKTLRVPIIEGHVPNVHVHVDLVGATTEGSGKKKRKRPAIAQGTTLLNIPPATRALTLDIKPKATHVEPGAETELRINVRDAKGEPVKGATMSVIVVDESVLALSKYQTPDPLPAFYTHRPQGARDAHNRPWVRLPVEPADKTRAKVGIAPSKRSRARGAGKPRADGARQYTFDDGAAEAAALLRSNFDALAIFEPEAVTDAEGNAVVPFKLPDNLTRYRVMVVAAAGKRQFGHGETAITARKQLMVRPSPPRFLNVGDRIELPVVVQNQGDTPMDVEVAIRATNLTLTDERSMKLTVPAQERVEVRFAAAAKRPGTARFQVVAGAGKLRDAAELALPVWTPATTEAFATYGVIDDEEAVLQPVAVPSGATTEFGGLEVTTSSTQLQALTDAFIYLASYPYGCGEQVSSRMLAVTSLEDVLDAFDADGLPSPAARQRAMRADITKLASLQNSTGGFGWWHNRKVAPFVSIHITHALVRAQQKGYPVDEAVLSMALSYLRNIRKHLKDAWQPQGRATIRAYALYVLSVSGDARPAHARALVREFGLEKLNLDSLGWTLSVLAGDPKSKATRARIHRHLNNQVVETAGAANWTTRVADRDYLLLRSSRRTDAILLDALIKDAPKSDLIPKVVQGLLAHQRRGRWRNTQENVFVLLALNSYFRKFESQTPDFVARAWLGDGLAGEHRFEGRQTDRQHTRVPMAYLADLEQHEESTDLTLAKEGTGRMYYRVGMSYAPKSLEIEPTNQGFAVSRKYEAVDDPNDVKELPDGSWRIKSGSRVRIVVSMSAKHRRYHVALVDPLPAGLEAINSALATTETGVAIRARGPQRHRWWWAHWYEHQQLRDDRAEAFQSLLPAGSYTYTYAARATTPGNFVAPPPKAEEMYSPETFGRGGTDRVVIQ